MAFITIEDLYGTAEVLTFENTYLKSQSSLIEENIVLVKGRLSIRDGEKTTIIANEITDFSEKKSKVLSLDITGVTEETKVRLRGAIKYFNGEMNNIRVQIIDGKINNESKDEKNTNNNFVPNKNKLHLSGI